MEQQRRRLKLAGDEYLRKHISDVDHGRLTRWRATNDLGHGVFCHFDVFRGFEPTDTLRAAGAAGQHRANE